ncbi:hypothetical protein Tco_1127717, partial [Tanacetum coccineum]
LESREVPKVVPLSYCYVLLDREPNTDADDVMCSNSIGKVGSTYRILVFGCEASDKLHHDLANKMSLRIGRCAMFGDMSASIFSNPFFIFISNNQIVLKIPHPTCQPTIQLYKGCVGSVIELILSEVTVKEQPVRSKAVIKIFGRVMSLLLRVPVKHHDSGELE